MYEVTFEYRDGLSNWEWRKQSGVFSAKNEYEAIAKCVKTYGLNSGCEHRIVSVKEV